MTSKTQILSALEKFTNAGELGIADKLAADMAAEVGQLARVDKEAGASSSSSKGYSARMTSKVASKTTTPRLRLHAALIIVSMAHDKLTNPDGNYRFPATPLQMDVKEFVPKTPAVKETETETETASA